MDPRDTDRICAISRNDVNAQALQPTPNQVEWAVDMAVRGRLRSQYLRQGGYRSQTGLGTIDPQGLFPVPKLVGGDGNGRIPANVLLGIMAQDSNLRQAEGGVPTGHGTIGSRTHARSQACAGSAWWRGCPANHLDRGERTEVDRLRAISEAYHSPAVHAATESAAFTTVTPVTTASDQDSA